MNNSALNILLVGSKLAEREHYRSLLERDPQRRYSVFEASDARAGLDIAVAESIDCILLDGNLADASGVEVLQKLERTEGVGSAVVIFLVRAGEESLAADAIKHGARDYVVHGSAVSTKSLSHTITSAVERARAAREQTERMIELEGKVSELDHAVRAREEFLSIAAHELKTPITATKLKFQTALRLIDRGSEEILSKEKLTQLFRDGDRQMNRLARLIDNLLDLSRIQSGHLSLRREPMDLVELVREVVGRFADQLAFASCPVSIDLPEHLTGDWDRDRLEQVITNLITNVIRYAPKSSITLNGTIEGDAVRLTFADTGPGIAREAQATIFDRYERANVDSRNQGLGLGLFISREIVHAHGGSIRVDSVPGEGTCFTIRLPVRSQRIA